MKNLGNTIDKAVAYLIGDATCVLYRTEEDIQISREKGIRPLVLWMAEDENALRGAAVADRIVGRAAAFLAVYGGVRAVYGEVMSEGAVSVLKAAGIAYSYKTLTDRIINRRGDGPCPMEQAVAGITDPAQAAAVLRAKVFDGK